MAAALETYEQAYTNTQQRVPVDPWEAFAQAARGAAIYE